jgi:hypothetical protein
MGKFNPPVGRALANRERLLNFVVQLFVAQ